MIQIVEVTQKEVVTAMKTNKSQTGSIHLLLLVAVVVAVIGGVGYYVYSKNVTNKPTTTTSTTKQLEPVQKHVSKVEFSNDTDNSGAAVNPTTTFTANTPKINTVISLLNVKKDTRVSYTRYLKDKFVDNGGLTVAKDNAVYAGFDFTLKAGKTHPIGDYTVKIYVNGDYQTSAKYSVK